MKVLLLYCSGPFVSPPAEGTQLCNNLSGSQPKGWYWMCFFLPSCQVCTIMLR